jgi:hypothetical protein
MPQSPHKLFPRGTDGLCAVRPKASFVAREQSIFVKFVLRVLGGRPDEQSHEPGTNGLSLHERKFAAKTRYQGQK